MILVTGGSFQGKKEFAERFLMEAESGADMHVRGDACMPPVRTDGGTAGRTAGGTVGRTDGGAAVWTDGGTAVWEQFIDSRYCCNLQLFVRRVLNGDMGPVCRGNAEPVGPGRPHWEAPGDAEPQAARKRLDALLAALLSGPLNRILVTDEIGCGIVPTDPFERLYREETGRLCCRLAREAEQVWRVNCGVGLLIK